MKDLWDVDVGEHRLPARRACVSRRCLLGSRGAAEFLQAGSSRYFGFSLVELLVALAIGAAVITVGVMIFGNLGAGTRATSTFENVTIGTSAMQNFFGINATSVDAPVAPNYGQRAQADRLRDLFWEDVEKSSAVYCLGRSGLNATHPLTITLPAGWQGRTAADLPSGFRAVIDPSGATFADYRGASSATNASIFLLRPSVGVGELLVQAVYDIDLVPTTSPLGTYVSVRRYRSTTMTDYYGVFYPAGVGTVAFSPLVVLFERAARSTVSEGAAVDRVKVAAGAPFYFVWWPDPAAADLELATVGSYGSTDPRASYPSMGGRTSLFFAVPMFPAL